MIKEDVINFTNDILRKLQKRDGIVLDNKIRFRLSENPTVELTDYELGNYIGIIFSKFHSVPIKYLRFYVKKHSNHELNFKFRKENLTRVKFLFKNYHPDSCILAGGSMAKTYLSGVGTQKVVTKEAKGWSANKLKNEANFLLRLSNFPAIKNHLPKVIDYKNSGDLTTLKLKYIPFQTLSYKILFEQMKYTEAKLITKNIFDFASHNLWVLESAPTPKNYVNEYYLDRIINNARMMIEKSPFMARIFCPNWIVINNRKYQNLLNMATLIKKDKKLLDLLTPPKTSVIWGDLHPNNIIITSNSYVLIDPRGNNGDYLYDLGKMYHTYGPGRYDFIDNDLFEIEITEGKIFNVIRRFRTDHPSWTMHNKLGTYLSSILSRYIQPRDNNWRLRWEFLKFSIFATMPLFLLKDEPIESRALMGYTNAIIFGEKFLDFYQKYGN